MGLKISVTAIDSGKEPYVIFENLRDYNYLVAIITELAHEWEIVTVEEVH